MFAGVGAAPFSPSTTAVFFLFPAFCLPSPSCLSAQNKCVPYWPELGSTKEYGPYLVENIGEHDALEYKLRHLCVCPKNNVSVPGWGLPWSLLGAVVVLLLHQSRVVVALCFGLGHWWNHQGVHKTLA